MVKAYLDKKVKLDEFITHKMTLDQVNDAIELMKHGKWWVRTPSSPSQDSVTQMKTLLTGVVSSPQHPDGPECFSTMRPLQHFLNSGYVVLDLCEPNKESCQILHSMCLTYSQEFKVNQPWRWICFSC